MSLQTAPFTKMHGLGNDFVMIDLRAVEPAFAAAARRPRVAAALADRRRGVGCDQVILIDREAEAADARLTFLNADGSSSAACGNGARCAADYLMNGGDGAIALETAGGRLSAARRADGSVTVDMGPPRFDWREIPLSRPAATEDMRAELAPALDALGTPPPRAAGAVSMGNPHCVLIVEDVARIDIVAVGARIERDPLFPERANIGFVHVRPDGALRYRVFERGVGVTEACGSGACAALAVSARLGFGPPANDVYLDGGRLRVTQDAETGRIHMAGPTARVFDGRLTAEWLSTVLGGPDG